MDRVKKTSGERLYKAFVYLVLGLLAISIIVPVAWVFLASIKQNSEFYGNPWALPAGFYWQNFVDAWNKASMGSYMLNSVIVTALALAILLVVALPAAYVLSRFQFKGRKFLHSGGILRRFPKSFSEKGFVKGVFPQEFHYVSKYIKEPLKQFYRYQLISFQKPISGLSYVPTITPRSKNAFLSSQHVSGNKPHA